MGCLITTRTISEYAQKMKNLNLDTQKLKEEKIKALIKNWQEANNKGLEEYPSEAEMQKLIDKDNENNQLSKKFIKPDLKGNMTFSYGNNKADNVQSETTIEAIEKGERTATTRYSTQGNIEYWKKAKVGDIIEFTGANGEKVYVRVTKNLTKLSAETSAEEWSSKEGWSTEYFNSKVKPKIEKGEAYQLEYEYIPMEGNNLKNNENTSLFSTVSEEEMRKINYTYSPSVRRDRVTFIADLFSAEIDKAYEEAAKNLKNAINNTTGDAQAQLISDLKNLSRFSILQSITPREVFNKVLKVFTDYVEDSKEARIQQELNKINSNEWASEYSEEEKLEAAKKKAAYKFIEYQKIIDNFKALAEESSYSISKNENVLLDFTQLTAKEIEELHENEDEEGESEYDFQQDEMSQEEKVKDGWMINVRQVSGHDSLTADVRKAISKIPRLDKDGYWDEDDLGNIKYLNGDYVYATLITALYPMIDSDDLIPLLQKLSKTKQWAEQLIDVLQNDDVLFSQFYQCFNKDRLNYWIQKKVQHSDGTFTVKTIQINKDESIKGLLDLWREYYEAGDPLSKESIYNKDGTLNKKNAKKGLDEVLRLTNLLNKVDTTEERLKLVNSPEIFNSIINLLHMAGIESDSTIVEATLNDIKSTEEITATDPILLLLPQLNIIFKEISEGKVKTKYNKDGEVEKFDIINYFSSAYTSIARIVKDVMEDAVESSSREGGKTYYAHTPLSYLGKLIKKLKNINPDKQLSQEDKKKGFKNYYEKVIFEEFRQYDWFYKDGHWRCDWVEKLAADPKFRDMLEHKVLLNQNKVEYADWGSLDYMVVMLSEYWSDPTKKTAYYHIPILSDSPSAEFIKFIRYTDGSEVDEEGNPLSYQDIISNKLIDLVNQEYDRIQLVRQRYDLIKRGIIKPIDNFDISEDKVGGAEFKFLPVLNTFRTSEGKLFLEELEDMIENEENGNIIKNFIFSVIKQVMNDSFEQDFIKWNNMGLLDELENGKRAYLPFEGQSARNAKLIKSLDRVKELLKTNWTAQMEELYNNIKNNRPYDSINADRILNNIKQIISSIATNKIISDREAELLGDALEIRDRTKDALREYYWNSKFATSQIIQITTTDLAYYKNLEDFQKRYKQVHAPTIRLNTKATFKGKLIGRVWERNLYLNDEFITSTMIDDLKEVLEIKKQKGEISATSENFILDLFKKVNVTDAQAYRCLGSYRAIMGMSGQWNEAMEQAFEHFKDGTWDIEDFSIIWQTQKPFLYSQINKASHVDGFSDIKTPVQHKNSEFLLLAAYHIISSTLGTSSKLRAINDFMEDNNIDVVQFTSAVKVGGQGAINLSNVDDYDSVYNTLLEQTGINTGQENNDIIDKIPYADYGIISQTPEHLLDTLQLVGTQIRKLITADMSPNIEITVADKTMTKAQWLDLYNKINTENIIEKFIEIDEIFSDPKNIERILKEEIRNNPRYSPELAEAVTLDENGNFTLPLYDPIQSNRIQMLLNSIIKSRVTKQKIKGGSAFQVSAFGLSDKLNIVWQGEGEHKHIKYYECYLPAYSRQMFEPLIDSETHQLDVSKLPQSLRKIIGYRVPTEDKYSMIPLYIKGFLPQQNGSAIMLPAEITTITGSDFDIDKLYLMLPEFNVIKYDYAKAKYYYAKEKDGVSQLSEILKQMTGENTSISEVVNIIDDANPKLNDWIAEQIANGDPYGIKLNKQILKKVKYDYNKEVYENNRRARNNALIDLIWGVLTNSDTITKMMNPGGFDRLKRTGKIMQILNSFTIKELQKELSNLGVQIDPKYSITNYINTISNKNLDILYNKVKNSIDSLSPLTQIYFHTQNMTGAKLIGIYAIHNTNHAAMQHVYVGLNDGGSFILNNRSLISLSSIKDVEGNFISKNNAEFLAASVDNTKDPVLDKLLQNIFTADITMLLSRLGYNYMEIGLLMNQPIVKDIIYRFFRERNLGELRSTTISKVISEYSKKVENPVKDYSEIKNASFPQDNLMYSILLSNELQRGADFTQTSDSLRQNFYRDQLMVGFLFERISKSADALSDIVRATRSDTQGGAAGPTIADNINKINQVDKTVLNSEKIYYPIDGVNTFIPDLSYGIEFSREEEESNKKYKERLRQRYVDNNLGYLNAFYELGVFSTKNLFKKYFPHYNDNITNVLEEIALETKAEKLDTKTMNNIFDDLFAYIVTKLPFFGEGQDSKGVAYSARQKRHWYIHNFPSYFEEIKSQNPDIANLEFIQRLKFYKVNKFNPVPTLNFKNEGTLTKDQREKYTRDWKTLMFMPNPAANKLAFGLLLYSFYRNGFAYSPSSFMHLAPTILRKSIPGYKEYLQEFLNSKESLNRFVDQYILNHLDNRKIVPLIPKDTTYTFTNSKGEPETRITLEVNDKSSKEDKSIILRTTDDEEHPFEFRSYICVKINDEEIYYRAVENGPYGKGTYVIYERATPLGIHNKFLEYEYGMSVTDMRSVLAQNDINYRNPLESNSLYSDVDVEAKEGEEFNSYVEESMNSNNEDSFTQAVYDNLFIKTYGVSPKISNKESENKADLSSLETNDEFKDEEGNSICK